jgi:PAT family beta-lactamase induction signal transducer AmpG
MKIKSLFSPRMLVVFLMGFSSGMPLALIGSTLKARMTEAGIDLAIIGVFSLFQLPYTLKFLWSPFLDRFYLPRLGRRRGWLLMTQPLLALSILTLGLIDVTGPLWQVAAICFVVAFLSATQDILVDSYRRELLDDNELGWGSSLAVNGYKVALLLSGGIALILADHMNWGKVYALMAAVLSVGFVTTWFAKEPKVTITPTHDFKTAYFAPFRELFLRPHIWMILTFIVLYKIGDSMASDMTVPFFIKKGYTNTEIGSVAKLFGFWATIGGGLVGGAAIVQIGIARGLWIFGFLQAVSILGFAALSQAETSAVLLAVAISFENFTSGMGTAAYAAYLAQSTDQRFTATQYALLSSLTGMPRVLAGVPTGYLAQHLGWGGYFSFCTLMAVPGMLLLWRLQHAQPKTALKRT